MASDGVVYFGLSDGTSLTGRETRMGNQALLHQPLDLQVDRLNHSPVTLGVGGQVQGMGADLALFAHGRQGPTLPL